VAYNALQPPPSQLDYWGAVLRDKGSKGKRRKWRTNDRREGAGRGEIARARSLSRNFTNTVIIAER